MQAVLNDLINDIKLRHISAGTISDATGLDRKTVASILSGENDNPKIETICAIARFVGSDIAYSTHDSRSAIASGDISYYRTMLANCAAQVANKDRWILWLFFTCLGLIAVIVIICLISFSLLYK